MWKDIARGTGITAPNLAASLAEQAGDLGAAHALLALGLAFDAARPGDHVLLAGFGRGCDAPIFLVDATRSEECRVGKEWVSPCRFLGRPVHQNKNRPNKQQYNITYTIKN